MQDVRVQLVSERTAVPVTALHCAGDVVGAYGEELQDLDREHFYALLLDVKNRIVQRHLVSIGHATSALVHPREVFKAAILANACAIVVIHNHPSGDPQPSVEDVDITRRLVKAGELLGIPVLDHVVIGKGGHVSMTDRGLMAV